MQIHGINCRPLNDQEREVVRQAIEQAEKDTREIRRRERSGEKISADIMEIRLK